MLPGASSAIPPTQYLLSVPNGTQLATRAVARVPVGSSSRKISVPGFSGRESRTPQPWVLTTSVGLAYEYVFMASRLVTRRGIWARIRVLRRPESVVLSVESIGEVRLRIL